jgi:hypothetical protein
MDNSKMGGDPEQRFLTHVETIRLRAAFLMNISKREKYERDVKAEKEKKLAAIRKKLELQQKRLRKGSLGDHFRKRMPDLVELARIQVSDEYATQLSMIKDLYWRQLVNQDESPLKRTDGSSTEILMLPFEWTDRFAAIFFDLGFGAGSTLTRHIVGEVLDSVSFVLSTLVNDGKLQRQDELKIRRAMEVAGESGLRALSTEIGRNLTQQIEIELERMGYKAGDKIPKDVREYLAKEHQTTYPSITDAISKTKFAMRKPKT